MPDLLHKLKQFIKKEALFKGQDKLLLAVSGGVDSITLVHLAKKLNYTLEIAHCNFGLRGDESDLDEKLVRTLGEQLGIKVHARQFDTRSFADQKKISIQMAARELRYNWFNELIKTNNIDYLATAHHSGDQTETTLFNWARGTGVKGMRGILPKADQLVRPLLFTDKKSIVEYAIENNLKWREDASNESTKYHRNKLRNVVIPHLQEINPNLDQTIFNNTVRFRSMEEMLQNEVNQIKKQNLSKTSTGFGLALKWIKNKKGALLILETILGDFGINLDQTLSIMDAFGHGSGQQFQTSDYLLTLDREFLFIEKEVNGYEEILINTDQNEVYISGKTFTLHSSPLPDKIIKDPNIALLDISHIQFPIKVRNWQEGDRFTSLGMKHQKKVSDFMIDAKIPLNLKKRVVIFESKAEIFWIAGYRISDKFKVTSETKKCLIIKLHHHA